MSQWISTPGAIVELFELDLCDGWLRYRQGFLQVLALCSTEHVGRVQEFSGVPYYTFWLNPSQPIGTGSTSKLFSSSTSIPGSQMSPWSPISGQGHSFPKAPPAVGFSLLVWPLTWDQFSTWDLSLPSQIKGYKSSLYGIGRTVDSQKENEVTSQNLLSCTSTSVGRNIKKASHSVFTST